MKSLASELDHLFVQHDIGRVLYVTEPDAIILFNDFVNGWRLWLFKEKFEEILGWPLSLIFSHLQLPANTRLKFVEAFYAISPENAALALERFPDIVAAMSAFPCDEFLEMRSG